MAVEIIAEAAQGYEGDLTLARLLARAAVCADADAVKFQLVFADEIAAPGYKYFDLFRQLEMPEEAWRGVAKVVKDGGKRLYFDVFGQKSLDLAARLGADGVKVHATDFFNAELVRAALDCMHKVLISFGGITAEELADFLRLHRIGPGSKVCLMYGYQAEPTPVEANNLLRIRSLSQRFPGFPLGFMDHSGGDLDDGQTLALLALPLGVCCIEKHIGLDRLLELEDFPSALGPEGFAEFVRRVRRLSAALGSEDLALSEPERAYRTRALKVVVAARPLRKGRVLQPEDLALLRVGGAVHPAPLGKEEVVGRTLAQDLAAHAQITAEGLS